MIVGRDNSISLDLKDLMHSDLFKVSSGVPYALITCFLWDFVLPVQFPVTALAHWLHLSPRQDIGFEARILPFQERFAVPDRRHEKDWIAHFFLDALGSLAYNYGIIVLGREHNTALNFAIARGRRFSESCLQGETGRPQYAAAAMMIAGIVLFLILMIFVCWMSATSVSDILNRDIL